MWTNNFFYCVFEWNIFFISCLFFYILQRSPLSIVCFNRKTTVKRNNCLFFDKFSFLLRIIVYCCFKSNKLKRIESVTMLGWEWVGLGLGRVLHDPRLDPRLGLESRLKSGPHPLPSLYFAKIVMIKQHILQILFIKKISKFVNTSYNIFFIITFFVLLLYLYFLKVLLT